MKKTEGAANVPPRALEAAGGGDAGADRVPFREALGFWLKLGFISFGGPAGQIAIMHRELVERRRWISERRFLHALNYCMLLPGPEAQQLATYIGWLLHRTRGGLAAGVLFVLPSLGLLTGLAWLYMAYGETPLLAGLFYGIKPAVTAIVLHAAWRIGTRTLKNALLWALAAGSFLPSFVFIFAGGPLIESTHGNLAFTAPLTAITAAVVGVIVNLAVFFAGHVCWPTGMAGPFDLVAALIGLGAAVALVAFGRHVIEVIALSALAGLLASAWGS